uniref:Dystroglycan 1 n=1 Tax=Timema cristinae TaxID=61476 RepID=A0A7R9CPM0_TIMCR|nr:unnamed protein product [Timema cristinae]
MAAATLLLVFITFISLSAGLAPEEEEDFAFVAANENVPQSKSPVQRLWGIPDSLAPVGRLFRLNIPRDAFKGDIEHYQAQGPKGSPLPSWLVLDPISGVLEGVPGPRDIGETYITVRAVGHDSAKDVFSLEVTRTDTSLLSTRPSCDPGVEATLATLVMDSELEKMTPQQRLTAMKNLAGFLGLSRDEMNHSYYYILYCTVLSKVGCHGLVGDHQAAILDLLKSQARDGTLAEVLQQPVVGWYVATEPSLPRRDRRDLGQSGSGDGEDYEYDDEDYGEGEVVESETEAVPESRVIPTMSSPAFPAPTITDHPHRHHHGELPLTLLGSSESESSAPSSPGVYGTILPTPVLVPIRPTHLSGSSEVLIEATRVYEDYAETFPSATPVFLSEVQPTLTTEDVSTQSHSPLTHSSSSDSMSSTEESPTTGTEEDTATPVGPSTSSRPPDGEVVEFDTKNIPPSVGRQLPRLPITAGKFIRYKIPESAFSDLEDGNTRNLRLIFKAPNGTSVSMDNWVQFNPESQEVYALPLDENVSRWPYLLEALDSEGASVSQTLEIVVQHHKIHRTVNHEFSLHLHIDKKFDFPSAVDWELHVLEGLARLYGDPDTNQITVRNITLHSDPIIFTWTNDSIPRRHCPRQDIDNLFKVLTVNEAGDPSFLLKEAMRSAVRVKKVLYRGLGQCEAPRGPLLTPQQNFPPMPRNQVDHINATVGQLLVYPVPEDSFYDPEDGNSRNLKLSLLTMDRQTISPDNWLQFDTKNQEFYGVPSEGDQGRREYQLVCEDSAGQTANDGLVVVVHPAPRVQYSVEFVMKLNIDYSTYKHSSSLKRKFVEKLCELFNERNLSAVALGPVTAGSTLVTWYNRSLSTDTCPEAEIRSLRHVLMSDNGGLSERVGAVMGSVFPVMSAEVAPLGRCQGELTIHHAPEGPPPPSDDSRPVISSDDYLVTFIVPAVIIAVMLALAGAVACVLYRRRRTGKMAVGDEDERQSFRNKGIPVIFQDELEDRPDPGDKSPVIMKEEKPPLPPPEYQRGSGELSPPPGAGHPLLGEDDAPYQPPPPFTSSRESGRNTRPKPTPTYRKPPPYVPP